MISAARWRERPINEMCMPVEPVNKGDGGKAFGPQAALTKRLKVC